MTLWEKAKAEFIDIIEWTDDSADTMVFRFPRYNNEIKYSAQLIVRQSQAAVFVKRGQIADIFPSGHYTLDTDNLPILSTLAGWKYGFSSPFKAEIYFVNLRNFTNLKWGTRNPVVLRDPELGPLRIKAFGSYVVKISDPSRFIREIVGTEGKFTLDQVTEQLRNLIITRFSDLVGEKSIPVFDLTASYDELSSVLTRIIAPEFLEYGLDITKLLVENISFPPEVEAAIDKKSSMGIVGNLDNYFRYQSANAMESAAANPGGDAASGIGMGMGFAMAGKMGEVLTKNGSSDDTYNRSTPPTSDQKSGQSGSQPDRSEVLSGERGETGSPDSDDQGGAILRPPEEPEKEIDVEYYIGSKGKKIGPLELKVIIHNIKKEKISPDTLIWRKGLDGWKKASEIEELISVFESVPPPLPDSEI